MNNQQIMKVGTESGITVHAFDPSETAVLQAIQKTDLRPSTKRKYAEALVSFFDAGHAITDAAGLETYAAQLNSTTARRHLQAAVSKWTTAVRQQLRNVATSQNLATVQATMYRLDGLQNAITVKGVKGDRVHIWLTAVEQAHLLELVDTAVLSGQRDNVLLRLMLGTGLRRNEAAAVKFEHIKQMGNMPVLEILGKGQKRRIVPLGNKLASLLNNWRKTVNGTAAGFVLRSVAQSGDVGSSLSDVSIFRIVRKYGRLMNKPQLAPHDLRRTFAENLRRNGVDIVTISELLGHESIETTRRYLNVNVDLTAVGGDFLPW